MPVRRMPVRIQLDARPAGAYASPTWANAVLHAVEQHVHPMETRPRHGMASGRISHTVAAVDTPRGHGLPELPPPLQGWQDPYCDQPPYREEASHGSAPVQEPQGRRTVGRVHQVRAIQGRACGRMQVGVPHAPENRAGQAPLDVRTAVHAEHRHHHEACGRLLRSELHRAGGGQDRLPKAAA